MLDVWSYVTPIDFTENIIVFLSNIYKHPCFDLDGLLTSLTEEDIEAFKAGDHTALLKRPPVLTIPEYVTNAIILSHWTYPDELIFKYAYVKEYFPNATFIPLPHTMSKAAFASLPNTILIDDYKKNVDEWRAAGGTALCVQHQKVINY